MLVFLPAKLERLRDLANNVWWSRNHDAIELYRRLDWDLLETTGHNAVLMLGTIIGGVWAELSEGQKL